MAVASLHAEERFLLKGDAMLRGFALLLEMLKGFGEKSAGAAGRIQHDFAGFGRAMWRAAHSHYALVSKAPCDLITRRFYGDRR